MRNVLFVFVALMLAGCQTTNVDDAIRKNLPTACAAIDAANTGFLQINANHPLSPGLVRKVAVAYAAAGPLCADPSHVTVANALTIVVEEYAVIVQAIAEAKRAGA